MKSLYQWGTATRAKIEVCFKEDTAYPGAWDPENPAAGHCAVVAIYVQAKLGGKLVSTTVGGLSHWFNRVPTLFGEVDIDLTGDQFGLPKVQVGMAGSLYSKSKVRDLRTDVNTDTFSRTMKFRCRLRD